MSFPHDDLGHPPEFDRAPAWARTLYSQQRRDRHHANGEMQKLQGEVRGLKGEQRATNEKLGEEPDSDGKGGKGLIGDVRKMNRDLTGLLDLKSKGLGFIAAVVLFGAIIVAGLIHMVQGVTGGAK